MLLMGIFWYIFVASPERKGQSNLKIGDIVFYLFGASGSEDLKNALQLVEYPI